MSAKRFSATAADTAIVIAPVTTLPDADSVRGALQRVLASRVFGSSERMKRFLRFTVEESLAGRNAAVKEYAIALAVYDKPSSFDSRIDPIVRVEASRLRAKLREYYMGEGRHDSIVISIQKRGYGAIIEPNDSTDGAGRPLIRMANATIAANAEAHHLYLKGRHSWNKQTPKAMAEAIASFGRALDADPKFAMACNALADCYVSLAWLEAEVPVGLWAAADRATDKARTMSGSGNDTGVATACREALFDWEWTASELSFRERIAKQPEDAAAHHAYAMFCLAPQRRLIAGLDEIAKACELDPLSPGASAHLGAILYFRRQYAEAVEQLRRTIEMDPGFQPAYCQMALVHAQLEQYEPAVEILNHARQLGDTPQTLSTAGFLYAAMGKTDEARAALEALKEAARIGYVSPVAFAVIYTGLEDRDAAFQWIDKAMAERSPRLAHFKVDPVFDRLKPDPRFLSILSSLNLL